GPHDIASDTVRAPGDRGTVESRVEARGSRFSKHPGDVSRRLLRVGPREVRSDPGHSRRLPILLGSAQALRPTSLHRRAAGGYEASFWTRNAAVASAWERRTR